ncbi:esterase/lipase family protein [Nocardioides sp. B-3]|uniref:esterase/lipase family protein n=1 Tax=Nocardioides sp. B-3 TaxID=2895565 RepID=UPI0021526D13|nr:alpha/beta hydrolase [Nocardioides sp. B-3]UUZ60038.1 alpha/beta hydrolase [Nocardioides sp. B-3]
MHGVLDRSLGAPSAIPGLGHRVIAGSVYTGVGLSLKGLGAGLDVAARSGAGPVMEAGARGRFVRSAANGLIGDRLERERPRPAITMAPRVDGRDVSLTSGGLASAYPTATGRVAVFLHGLCENEAYWQRNRERRGTTYADELTDLGWTPVLLRVNTGLSVRTNGASLAALLEHLVENWPTGVTELALIGHSMGGLVIRAATAVQGEWTWRSRVTNVVTLGTPHLGAPLARGVKQGSGLLGRLPEVAGFGRIPDQRSVGVDDLIEGLDEDFAPLPHALPPRLRDPGVLTATPRQCVLRRHAGAAGFGVRTGPPRARPLPRQRGAAPARTPLRPAERRSGRRGADPVADLSTDRHAPARRAVRCGRTGVHNAWNCRCFGLMSLA